MSSAALPQESLTPQGTLSTTLEEIYHLDSESKLGESAVTKEKALVLSCHESLCSIIEIGSRHHLL